jgi:hypothetical protein
VANKAGTVPTAKAMFLFEIHEKTGTGDPNLCGEEAFLIQK